MQCAHASRAGPFTTCSVTGLRRRKAPFKCTLWQHLLRASDVSCLQARHLQARIRHFRQRARARAHVSMYVHEMWTMRKACERVEHAADAPGVENELGVDSEPAIMPVPDHKKAS